MNRLDRNIDFFNVLTPYLLLFSLFLCTIFAIKSKIRRNKKCLRGPPSPLCLPIIGHMHLLSKYPTNPWLGFNEIRKRYGDIVFLKLGQVRAVLVSSADVMREVLLLKGDIFCDRPAFNRYALIFGRDRENSLALCDWSELQKTRRTIAQSGVLPKYGSHTYDQLSKCIASEVGTTIGDLTARRGDIVLTKMDVLLLCSNVFFKFLCSKRPRNSCEKYLEAVHNYDFVFYDINQCYAVDFLPFLSVFGVSKRYFSFVEDCANSLRQYVETQVVLERLEASTKRLESNAECLTPDFLESLLEHYLRDPSSMSWPVLMYEIGDLIGGHSAVGNLLMRLIGFVAINGSVQQDLLLEAKNALNRKSDKSGLITLEDRPFMPLTEASILETLRMASSPIVPHVNREETTLQDYVIEKGTMVLFNSFHLNSSPDYWSEPQNFIPSRFVTKNGNASHISKPDHFFPFSSGRRACLGYKMVQTIAFTAISNLILNFEITPIDGKEITRQLTPKGCLALDLSDECFKVKLIPRTH